MIIAITNVRGRHFNSLLFSR